MRANYDYRVKRVLKILNVGTSTAYQMLVDTELFFKIKLMPRLTPGT